MKNKRIIIASVIIVLLAIAVFGINYINYQKGKNATDLYSLTQNKDNTYSYSFFDSKGNILFEKHNVIKEPDIVEITPDIWKISTQTGTGLSTNWAVYCDIENSKVSETFYYVLGAQGDYVICGDYEDGKHLIIVQNIFDKSAYCQTYEIENVSPVAADFAIGCKFDSDSNATITYLTGENYTETEITIKIP